MTIGRGRGYVPAELNRGPEHTIGVIPIDSIFSPVRRVSYDVEAARVGQRTDYDKLNLDVTTDGSIDPKEAIGEGGRHPHPPADDLHDIERIEGFDRGRDRGVPADAPQAHGMENFPIEELELGVPLVQLPEAGRDRDDRRPRRQERERAGRDPELRQEVDRRGQGDAGHARPQPPRRRIGAMRHHRKGKKLGRDSAHRKALYSNLRRRRDRARPDQDDRRQGEGGAADHRGDDHARAARRPRCATAGACVPALERRRHDALLGRGSRGSSTGRAATRGS
jgi:hypothetical protein